MIREHFQFRETIATILADDPSHITAAKEGMMSARQELERYIARDPFFAITYDPYTPEGDGKVVMRMAEAAGKAGVGPMAAVAGAIAWSGVEAMAGSGARFGVIDNGGDIALVTDRELRIGLHAGSSPLSDRFAFLVPPGGGIRGVCTSSATVGPSVSLGVADSVTVFSENPASADAWATAICNKISPGNRDVLGRLGGTDITGVVVILGEEILPWGDPLPLVPARVDPDIITRGKDPTRFNPPGNASPPGTRRPPRTSR
ncbi:MAG TPA: UPF0280 family protein [Methanomicrobiales archaeon]|nr:UPF0280 family protein [Methanomicrobiales archaeon]